MDELKKHLQLNRSALDVELPGENVWFDLQERLQKGNAVANLAMGPVEPVAVHRLPIYLKWSVAAGLVLVIGLCGLLLMPGNQEGSIASTGAAFLPSNSIRPLAIPARTQDSAVSHQTGDDVAKAPAHQSLTHPKKTNRTVTEKVSLPPDIESIQASYTSMVERQLKLVESKPIYAEDASYFAYFKKQFADLVHEEKQVQQRFRLDGYSDQSLEDLLGIYQQKITLLRKLQFEINRMNDKTNQANAGKSLKPSYINL